jgi:signal transduction histidine kinase
VRYNETHNDLNIVRIKPSMHAHPPQPTRLLIVDDERPNLELMARVFYQHAVETASNGKDALEKLRTRPFDVVLLDIMMPGMSGLEVLETIRKTDGIAELPVILVSALSERKGVAHGLRMGANDYIVKPIDVEDVQARVQTQIRLKQYVDERKQIILHLQAMNERLERLMQVASHDLKNPMNNLNLLMSALRRAPQMDAKTLQLLDMAEHSLKTMLNVVQEFLDADTREDEVLSVNLTPTDARQVIRGVLQQYQLACEAKNIRINADDVRGVVMADAHRLAQVVSNLISNAIKYSPLNAQVRLSTLEQDGIWQLTVEDEGPGIPEAERDNLFQPFARLSNVPTAGESSTGLGLWIVREMMLLQGGEVGVYCPQEGGSHFWIQLPAANVARM